MRSRRPAKLLPPLATRIGGISRLILPIRLESILNGSRGSRFIQTEKKNRQKAEVARHIHLMAPFPNRPIDVTLTRIGPVALDDDNNVASFKYVRDAIAEALGIKDNDYERLRFSYDQEKSPDYGIRITMRTRGIP